MWQGTDCILYEITPPPPSNTALAVGYAWPACHGV